MITLHLVQEGDTLTSIAKQYNIPLSRLMLENDFDYYRDLNVGQIINILYPVESYIVENGDTIDSITSKFDITLLELLQNNPQINLNDGPVVGDYLVIRYEPKFEDLEVNGMCFDFIDDNVLKRTLPYLTYITVMGYMVDTNGGISDVDDERIIKQAKAYGTIPFMLISTENTTGVGSYDITEHLFSDFMLQERLMNNVIEVAKNKGYSGVVFGFQYVLDSKVKEYKAFIDYATEKLHQENLLSWEVVIPKFLEDETQTNRLEVTQNIDGVILLAYQWTTAFIPVTIQTTYQYKRATLLKLLERIDPSKISIGISRIAYDFELPYVEDQSFVSALTDPRAIALANQYGSVIHYDDDSKVSYYEYTSNDIEHVVWFKDPRYTVSILDLVDEFGLGGVTIWNIMYFSRIWFTINATSNIVKLLPVNEEEILGGIS